MDSSNDPQEGTVNEQGPEVEYSTGQEGEDVSGGLARAQAPGTFDPLQPQTGEDEEMAKLQEITGSHEQQTLTTGEPPEDDEIVKRSVYVGNVDYGATPQELQEHFVRCGKIYRITIMVDKFSGHPKGFAYIEFNDAASASNALMLSNTTLRGRQIKVMPKRKNIAGFTRGRGGRGRGAAAMPYNYAPFPMRG